MGKIEIRLKNRNYSPKSNILSKIEMLLKNQNFCQTPKFLSKTEIFVKNRNLVQKSKFSKIDILILSCTVQPRISNNAINIATV